MRYESLDIFLKDGADLIAKGPIALIFAEDEVEVASTLRHHLGLGFKQVILFAPDEITVPQGVEAQVLRVRHNTRAVNMLSTTVNRIIAATHGQWIYYCYNAEYLFYPFCETRNIVDLLTFHSEERRNAMLTYVVDLYAGDLNAYPNAVSLEDAHLDRSGYYALGRAGTDGPKERQLDFFGGLRWRFEEHVPKDRRRIDRIALFRAKSGLKLSENHLFNDEEYNTFACPWHNNLTAAIGSFRMAKALKANAGSTFDIHEFTWHNSVEFEWQSQQLLDLGLMEPGQWF
ncbi:glycosyltransferase family 2 protein [Celeribacter sp.]|uniref:glycosyltransferase family 2 protein n=1 Tax=Celeribacter sp. TaxID=1890673 RepID=UPI003A92E16E